MSASEVAAAAATPAQVVPIGFAAPVAETLPSALDRLVTIVRPRTVILFGSYAYGTPTPDSDVDLLVALGTSLSFAERYCLVSEALCPRPFPVDLIVVTRDELVERLASGNRFFAEITRHGRTLYEQPE